MPEVHLITVGVGDCTAIRHNSGRITMIDICGGNRARKSASEKLAIQIEEVLKAANPPGNYQMCEKPTHPLDYLEDKNLTNVWRFISTHPDMDHLDGFRVLLDTYGISNFWHTGVNRTKPDFPEGCPYKEDDWDTYAQVKAGNWAGITSLRKLDGSEFQLANKGGSDDKGDYLNIASPSAGLVIEADTCEEYNDSSYIIVYRMGGGKVVICGDAEDGAFNHAIEKYPTLMKDVGFLLAPHHGRDGCAPHQHHRTQAWSSRGLLYCKQNQCGNMILTPGPGNTSIDIYIQSKSFAENSGGDTSRIIHSDMYFYKNV